MTTKYELLNQRFVVKSLHRGKIHLHVIPLESECEIQFNLIQFPCFSLNFLRHLRSMSNVVHNQNKRQ